MKETLLNPKILSTQILQFDITDDISKAAQKKSQRLGRLKNSITKGDGNFAGYIGQLAFVKLFGGKEEDTFDYVAFFRVNLEKKKGWFCGYVTKEYFKKNSRSMKGGSLDTASSNNFEFHADCRNIFYSQCNREVGLK
jgi:hypothetical protein